MKTRMLALATAAHSGASELENHLHITLIAGKTERQLRYKSLLPQFPLVPVS